MCSPKVLTSQQQVRDQGNRLRPMEGEPQVTIKLVPSQLSFIYDSINHVHMISHI